VADFFHEKFCDFAENAMEKWRFLGMELLGFLYSVSSEITKPGRNFRRKRSELPAFIDGT
jgi:hypothetical protein